MFPLNKSIFNTEEGFFALPQRSAIWREGTMGSAGREGLKLGQECGLELEGSKPEAEQSTARFLD